MFLQEKTRGAFDNGIRLAGKWILNSWCRCGLHVTWGQRILWPRWAMKKRSLTAPGCLGYIGDEILPVLFGTIHYLWQTITMSLIKQPVQWKVSKDFFCGPGVLVATTLMGKQNGDPSSGVVHILYGMFFTVYVYTMLVPVYMIVYIYLFAFLLNIRIYIHCYIHMMYLCWGMIISVSLQTISIKQEFPVQTKMKRHKWCKFGLNKSFSKGVVGGLIFSEYYLQGLLCTMFDKILYINPGSFSIRLGHSFFPMAPFLSFNVSMFILCIKVCMIYYCIACVVSVSAKVTLLESAAFGQCIFSSWSGPLALRFQARGGSEAIFLRTFLIWSQESGWPFGGWGVFWTRNGKWWFWANGSSVVFFSDFSTVPFNKWRGVCYVTGSLPTSSHGGHLSPEHVTYGSKRGHFEEPGI